MSKIIRTKLIYGLTTGNGFCVADITEPVDYSMKIANHPSLCGTQNQHSVDILITQSSAEILPGI